MLSGAVMAHPSRREFVSELQGQLDRDIPVVWDRRNDRWDTGRRSLLAFDPDAEWHLVVQDDSVPCRDLFASVEHALDGLSEVPVSFYLGNLRPRPREVTGRVEAAKKAGQHWVSMPGPFWGVAICLPTSHVKDVVEFGDGYTETQNYDLRIARFYGEKGISCMHALPSLVDHRRVGENPSLVPGRTGDRHAHWFIGEDRSGLEIDWTKTPGGEEMPTHRNVKSGRTMRVKDDSPMGKVLAKHPDWEEIKDAPGPGLAGLKAATVSATATAVLDAEPDEAQAEKPADWHPTATDLADLTRVQLNNLAADRGIVNPDRFRTKPDVIEAIQAA